MTVCPSSIDLEAHVRFLVLFVPLSFFHVMVIRTHCPTMRSFILSTLASIAWLSSGVLGALVTHDDTFAPDHVLHITAQNISQACNTRYSAVVNGMSPGPTIRLQAGRAAWIRVYNDMEHSNVTMVRTLEVHQGYTGPASWKQD